MAQLEGSPTGISRNAHPLASDDDVKGTHEALVRHYVRILREVSELRPLGGRGDKHELYGGDWSVWRVFVRLFCEAHIRRQLAALSRVYLLEKSLEGVQEEQDSFLDEALKSCERVLTAIPSRQRVKLLIASLSPIVVGILAAVLGVDNVYEAVVKVVREGHIRDLGASLQRNVLIIYSLLAAAYLLLPFATSFAYTRGLFYPKVRYLEASRWSKRKIDENRKRRGLPEPDEGTNVYLIESNLFRILSFRRPKEPPIDVLVTVGTVATGLLAWSLYALSARGAEKGSVLLILTAIFAFLGIGIVGRALQVAFHREWR